MWHAGVYYTAILLNYGLPKVTKKLHNACSYCFLLSNKNILKFCKFYGLCERINLATIGEENEWILLYFKSLRIFEKKNDH